LPLAARYLLGIVASALGLNSGYLSRDF